MSNVLLAGLTDQEAAAAEIMVGMAWRDARCVVLRRSVNLAMPEQSPAARGCEHCVVDLFGIGLRRYTPENAERLLAFLGGRSAVGLAWAHGEGSWIGRSLDLAPKQIIKWLSTPYTSQDLRAALAAVRGDAPQQAGGEDSAAGATTGRWRPSFLRPGTSRNKEETPSTGSEQARTSFPRPGAAARSTRFSFLRPGGGQGGTPTSVAADEPKTTLSEAEDSSSVKKPALATRPSFLRPGTMIPVPEKPAKPAVMTPPSPSASEMARDNMLSRPTEKPESLGMKVPFRAAIETSSQDEASLRQAEKSGGSSLSESRRAAVALESPTDAASSAVSADIRPEVTRPASGLRAEAENLDSPVAATAPPANRVIAPPPLPGKASSKPVAAPLHKGPGMGLLSGAYPVLLNAFPELGEHRLFKLISRVLEIRGLTLLTSRETRAGTTAFIVDIRRGWVVSKMPAAVLLRVVKTPSMLKSVSAAKLPHKELLNELKQRFGDDHESIKRPLDQVCWALVSGILEDQVHPVLRGDLSFQLRRMPNFTVLGKVDTFEIQLASICMRTPQSIRALQAAFPHKDPRQIERFAILSIISGMAVIVSDAASLSKGRAAASSGKPEQKARKGFFKSLLDKLF